MSRPPLPGGVPSPGDPPPSGDPPWAEDRIHGTSASEAFPVPFSVLESGVLLVWTLLAQFLVAVPAIGFGLVDPADGPALVGVAIASQTVALVGILAWLSGRGRLSWRLLGPRRPRGGHLLVGVVVGVGSFVGISLLLAALIALFGPVESPDQELLSQAVSGGLATVLAIVAAVVMAPVLEELVFRGLLFQSLHRRVGLWPAALLSAVFFAAVHVEVTQPLYSGGLFLLGVGFALALARTGSLLVPIAAHAAFNATTITLALVAEQVEGV